MTPGTCGSDAFPFLGEAGGDASWAGRPAGPFHEGQWCEGKGKTWWASLMAKNPLVLGGWDGPALSL